MQKIHSWFVEKQKCWKNVCMYVCMYLFIHSSIFQCIYIPTYLLSYICVYVQNIPPNIDDIGISSSGIMLMGPATGFFTAVFQCWKFFQL